MAMMKYSAITKKGLVITAALFVSTADLKAQDEIPPSEVSRPMTGAGEIAGASEPAARVADSGQPTSQGTNQDADTEGEYTPAQLAFASLFGIPPDSPELKIFANMKGREFNIDLSKRDTKSLPQQVLGHYVLTKGVPLPDPRTMAVPKVSDEQSKELEQALADARKKIDELTRLTIERWGEARAIESCVESRSSKVRIAEGDKSGEVVFLDFLFLSKPPPLNAEELFGSNASVVQYRAGKEDPLSATVSGLGIPCLPYRIRLVGPWRFEHTGADALRDFDDAPLGKGKVNAKLRSVLKQFEE